MNTHFLRKNVAEARNSIRKFNLKTLHQQQQKHTHGNSAPQDELGEGGIYSIIFIYYVLFQETI